MIDWTIFKNRRVFLTGDTGFKGSWLSVWLKQLGAETTGYALPPERENDLANLLDDADRINHIDGDVRNSEALTRAVHEAKPEIIFHLAAQALVRRSYREPKHTLDTNISGTVNILEAARNCDSVSAVVVVTSDKCYRNKEQVEGYREIDELGGRDPYSASKAAAEHVFEAYNELFQSAGSIVAAATGRAGNVIGGGDRSEDRIVPDCIRALEAAKPLSIRNPVSTRPWQHVVEPLSGYLTLAAKLLEDPRKYAGSWNFGPRDTDIRSVDDVANEIVACWGSGQIQYPETKGAPHEAGLLHLNCDKARTELDWSARWNFREAIRHTVDWYRNVAAGQSAGEECRRQIQIYMDGSHD
jgi:CDP-glucose 4,6-dehydratase